MDESSSFATVVVSLVVGLGAGVVSAWVSGLFAAGRDEKAARREAVRAFRGLQRALVDVANSAESHALRDDSYFTEGSRAAIRDARHEAFTHIGVLPLSTRRLVERSHLDWHQDIMEDASQARAWADELGAAIDALEQAPRRTRD